MRIMSNISALFAVNAAKDWSKAPPEPCAASRKDFASPAPPMMPQDWPFRKKLRAQVRGLDQAVRMPRTASPCCRRPKGGLNETHALLQRMRQLSVQAANDTLTLQDRTYLQQEIDQLKEQITLISSTTQFNRKQLLSGDASVLWSTDSPHIRVFVDGSLRSRDAFGQNVVGEGNFRLSITPTAGEGEVQKTNIFYLKHGTVSENVQFSPESGAFSGLGNLRSSTSSTATTGWRPGRFPSGASPTTKPTARKQPPLRRTSGCSALRPAPCRTSFPTANTRYALRTKCRSWRTSGENPEACRERT